ncbi:MAG: T9SS type A sorting domain-containing protein [Fibrobacter sp.]|nr:T9SS type A sorting domain-containing protein [Fibrobacter sp.]
MNIRLLYTTVAALSAVAMAFQLWEGYSERVRTELENETKTEGYWFEFNDSIHNGQSKIIWPVDKGMEGNENSFQPVIEHCQGICGHIILSRADTTYDPFVGVGFNVVGYASPTDSTPVAGDATMWGGICIRYSSTLPATLELSLGEDIDKALNYDTPVVELPEYKDSTTKGYPWDSYDGTTKRFPWESFAQAGFGKSDKITGPEAAAKLVAIKFKVQAKESTEGDFYISQIGSLDACPHKENALKIHRTVSSVNTIVAGRKVSFTGITSSASVKIANLQGKIVKKGSVTGTSSLDLSALDAGVYIVRISNKSVDFSGKIVLK